ncbi:MAG: c-type cytochrome [Thermoanaerobaculia bacterium]
MRTRIAAALVAALLLALAALPLTRWALGRRELNPILRGRLLAAEQGCVTCHWPWAQREIPNPGSRWGSVPRLAHGNARMYAADRIEIEQFIRHGAPDAWLEDAGVRARLEGQLLRMPAYEGNLSDRQISDLVAFASAVERVELPGTEGATEGRNIYWKYGCGVCHGIEGSGGLANPGSLGGFVPGFLGDNFADMVRDEAEFREWVVEGGIDRLEGNPLIRFFLRRQRISMPAYGEILTDEQISSLWQWIEEMRGLAAWGEG